MENKQVYGIVYLIINKVNGKMYVGQTTQKLNNRWGRHKIDAKKNINRVLCCAIRKYGNDNFSIHEVEKCYSRIKLNEREIWWMKYFNSLIPNGYNMIEFVGVTEKNQAEKGNFRGRNASLEDKNVIEIKRLILENISFKDIAKKFDVKPSVISKIATENTYYNIPWSDEEKYSKWKEENIGIKKISDNLVIEIKNRLLKGEKVLNIANSLKLNISIVEEIKNDKHYKNIPWPDEFDPKKYKNASFKLTEKNVLKIKKLIIDGKSNKEIAKQFCINHTTVSEIRNNKKWKNVGWPPGYDPSIHTNTEEKLTTENVKKIKQLIIDETSFSRIAKLFNVKVATISRINRDKNWKYIPWPDEDKHKQIIEKQDKIIKNKEKFKTLPEEIIYEIRKLIKQDKTYKEIEKIVKIPVAIIGKISRGEIYNDIQ